MVGERGTTLSGGKREFPSLAIIMSDKWERTKAKNSNSQGPVT
jgi:hypothetical protein